MAKKLSGNPFIDQFTDFQDFVKRMRAIASILYFETEYLVYVNSVFDYERIIILLDTARLNLSGYKGVAVEPNTNFDILKELRKTMLSTYYDKDHNLIMESSRKGYEGNKLVLTTNQTQSVVETGKDLGELIKKDAYHMSDGSNVFDDMIREVLDYNAAYTVFDQHFLDEYFEMGMRYFNDPEIKSDYSSLMISRESFPLLSEKTEELSYRILGIEEEYADLLYKEKEDGYTIFTYLRYMIG